MEHAATRYHRRPRLGGLFHDETANDSFWLRDHGWLELPPLAAGTVIAIDGEVLPASAGDPTSHGGVGLVVSVGATLRLARTPLPDGPFKIELAPPAGATRLAFALTGVGFSNVLAWLGRVTGFGPLQPWRRQARNRRLRIRSVSADGEVVFDFSNRSSPFNPAILRRNLHVGLNVVGYFRSDLGVGESARCMARAADAAGLPAALVDLKLPCKNPMTDDGFVTRLQETNPHAVNVMHIDAPGMRDLDHHHGAAFRRGRYNIGYWAWELPEFPDAWIGFSDYCDEIWTPSRFTTAAIAEKVPVPVLTMPHAISFARPAGDFRPKFGLPADRFLFLFLYDLNSYSERKNPAAVIEAFRASGLAERGASLVVKVHNVAGNEADFSRLQQTVSALPGTVLIARTLARTEIYELEAACDCFVSLHRSEGFGLAVAESMFLGKPVIATDWSATAEFVNETNGRPVRCSLVTLDRNHGPYAKGQTWAQPDIAHAAERMREVFADAALRARLGTAARETIERDFAPAAIGARYRRRLEAIATW